MPAIVNLIYMPIAVLMIIFAPKAMVHGMFYNKVTKSWTGKRW